MALPSYYISTSVTCVDTTATSKVLMLPPANTIPNVNLYIYDAGGAAATNPIYVSTQQGDEMDNGQSLITLNANNQSFRITPYNATKYAICQNYTQGLTPFQYAVQIILEFLEVSLDRAWQFLAVGPTGEVMLAVTNGGTNEGFYVSDDGGASFSRYEERTGTFVSCAVSLRYMYVLDSTGIIYRSDDNGLIWTPLQLPEGRTWISMAVNEGGDYIIVITANDVFWSSTTGNTFNNASFPIGENVQFTNCAFGDAPSVSQDDIVVYITAQDTTVGGDYIYVCTNLTEGNPFNPQGPLANWTTVSCNQSGSIAYALNDAGQLFKSTDYGQSWTYIDLAITLEPFYNTQIKCSSDGQILFGINGAELYFTDDGAASFTLKSPFSGVGGLLTSYGLSSNGRSSLFSVINTNALNVGRTRVL